MTNANKRFRVLTWVAITMVVGGLCWALAKAAKLESYQKTKGEVVEMGRKTPERHDADRDIIYYPRIRYHDREGQTYIYESKIGSEEPRLEEGDTIDLLFNQNDPNDVLIDSFFRLWLGPSLVLAAGFAMLLLAIVMVRRRRG